MPTSYVTTAIPYVNSDPHVGFALEALIADATARHRRLSGDDVRFLSGTDDNSLKSVQAAEREGVAVGSLVEHYSARFEALPSALDLSVDDFIRTSIDPRHRPGVERLWRECAESGDIYKGHYRGRYCIDCEAFIDDQELDDGCCPEHHTMPEEVDEENWFFRLSRYQDRLDDLIASGGLRVVPDARRN
jgi:methionyl-tRNA synthetase